MTGAKAINRFLKNRDDNLCIGNSFKCLREKGNLIYFRPETFRSSLVLFHE